MQEEKLAFISKEMFLLLKSSTQDTKRKWGKMNLQQMVEHVRDFFNVSIEQIKFGLITPDEDLPKYKAFLLSEKEFRENTKAPLSVLGEDPIPLRYNSLIEATDALKITVSQFKEYFNGDPEKKTIHPVFGPLNYEEWILLHYKHITHHLRQFGLLPTPA